MSLSNNLSLLLLAEKEEKRQLYNRLKNVERKLEGREQEARLYRDRAETVTSEVKQLRAENAQLDQMLAKLMNPVFGPRTYTAHNREFAALILRDPRPLVAQYEVVASTCVLTQLIDAVAATSPGELQAAVLAERGRHLDLLLALTAPGGASALFTRDYAS